MDMPMPTTLTRLSRLVMLSALVLLPRVAISAGSVMSKGSAIDEDTVHYGLEVGEFVLNRSTGEHKFVPKERIEMVPGKAFGWRMALRSSKRTVTWSEAMSLPYAPTQWGVAPNVTVSQDRTRSVTTETQRTERGYIEHTWIFVEGDPTGKYHLSISVDGVEADDAYLHVY